MGSGDNDNDLEELAAFDMHMQARDLQNLDTNKSCIEGGAEDSFRQINNDSRLFLESFSARDSDLLDDKDLLEMQAERSVMEDVGGGGDYVENQGRRSIM